MKALIGACGGLTGLYLTKRFKHNFYINMEVYGFDSNEHNPTKFFLDAFFISPKLSEEKEFLSFLISTVNNNNIDFYIPTYSKEIELISKYEMFIRENSKTHFIISSMETISNLEDKKIAYKNLKSIGIEVPKVFESEKDLIFPMFCKPRIGSGSKRNSIVYNEIQRKALKELEPDLIFMEVLEGIEYTVDAVFDYNGELIAYNQRIREKTMGGAVIISSNNFDIDCKEFIVQISQKYKIKGVCNFQFFLTEKGIIFTDINLRFASGGLPLSVASGVDIPEILIKIMLGEEVKKQYCSDKKKRTMYRYFEEIFEEESGESKFL